MGSAGSDQFERYRPQGGGGKGGPIGGQEDEPSEDRCRRAFSISLEDVEHSEYFIRTSRVPPLGSRLTIALRKRLVALDDSGETVGSLPTSMNYLADCLDSGFQYSGVVTAAILAATATLVADFAISP